MLKILESQENLRTLLNMDIFSVETKQRVEKADIVFIPDIGKIEGIAKAFRPDTKTFYKFVTTHNPLKRKIEILENDGEIQVLNFHSHEVWLPSMYIRDSSLVTDIMNFVNDYVAEKQNRKNEEDLVINFYLKVENGESGVCNVLSFKGALKDLNESISKIELQPLR